MSVKVIQGSATTSYKIEDFFAAIAIVGEELDYVRFVGMYRSDDIIELQLNPNTMAVSQVTIAGCQHFDFNAATMPIPHAEEGIVIVDMPKQSNCDDLWVTVYDDGLAIRVVNKLPIRYARMGDVLFGVAPDDELTSILLTSLSPKEIAHARAELSGEGYDKIWSPEGT